MLYPNHLPKDQNVFTAQLVENLLNSNEGVSEDIFHILLGLSFAMPDCESRKYIKSMLNDVDATDGYFYLKEFKGMFTPNTMKESD
jgi:hypothetical protein